MPSLFFQSPNLTLFLFRTPIRSLPYSQDFLAQALSFCPGSRSGQTSLSRNECCSLAVAGHRWGTYASSTRLQISLACSWYRRCQAGPGSACHAAGSLAVPLRRAFCEVVAQVWCPLPCLHSSLSTLSHSLVWVTLHPLSNFLS